VIALELLQQVSTSPVAWQLTPGMVATRMKQATDLKAAVKQRCKSLPESIGYGEVYWNPDTKVLWLVFGDSDTSETINAWKAAMQTIPDVSEIRVEAEYGPRNDADWIKLAGALSAVDAPYQLAGKLTGGPSPLSNAIVSGLLGGGLGYVGGTIAEQFLPEQHVEPGKLRRTAAMLGAAGGAALHIPQWAANAGINRTATGRPEWLKSLLGDQFQKLSPHEHAANLGFEAMLKQSRQIKTAFASLSLWCPRLKLAETSGAFGNDSVPLQPVPIDAFNNAIWNDVHNGVSSSQNNPYGTRDWNSGNAGSFHTPPMVAAAASGLVSGIQQQYGGASMLSPMHFIHGLAAAGVDAATARIAGGVLGVLGGLKPDTQKQLQQMGIWSGMLRGVTGSVLGLP